MWATVVLFLRVSEFELGPFGAQPDTPKAQTRINHSFIVRIADLLLIDSNDEGGSAFKACLLKDRIFQCRFVRRNPAHTLALNGYFLSTLQFRNRIPRVGRETEAVDDRFLVCVYQDNCRPPHAAVWRTGHTDGAGNNHDLSLIELVRLSFAGLVCLVQFFCRDCDTWSFAFGPFFVHRLAETGTTEDQTEPQTEDKQQRGVVFLHLHSSLPSARSKSKASA